MNIYDLNINYKSRTIHRGCDVLKDRLLSNFRAIIYLCYMHRSLCDKKNLEKKAFLDLRTTNHYHIKSTNICS